MCSGSDEGWGSRDGQSFLRRDSGLRKAEVGHLRDCLVPGEAGECEEEFWLPAVGLTLRGQAFTK